MYYVWLQSLQESSEKLKTQGKELKEADSQRKMAMQEFAEVSEKVTELRSHKQRLSRQLRDKEEEMDSLNQKVEALRLEVRKAERAKKEVSVEENGRSQEFVPQTHTLNMCKLRVCAYRWRPRLKSGLLRLRKRRS